MNKKSILSKLPSVDELLNCDEVIHLIDQIPRKVVVNSIRKCLQNYRNKILAMKESELANLQVNMSELIENVIYQSEKFMAMNLRKVINATGVVLHTNLGRALLSDEIKEEVWSVAAGYSNLELNVDTGKRGSRYSHVVELIKYLTGADDALVVNNNAAAVMLVLSTMAKEKEVIVSRGELVEIGGSFRVPDVMEQSGAKLVDIGTTNKTHLWDYEKALGENTAALLKVHTSNYKILGFTEEVALKELVALGRKNNVPVIEDLGSGVLVDLQKYGLTYEPTVQESVALGVDVVTFSGDKLLGGPQAGIIVGNKHWIDQMKKNPLTRAFRIDKLTMAALEATLKLYLDEEEMIKKIPTLKMLTESVASLQKRAQQLYDILANLDLPMEIKEDFSQVGGGSLPLEKLPTKVIAIKPMHLSVSKLEEKLRSHTIPIITRIQEEQLIIDVRTIKEEDYDIIKKALKDTMKI
ncbi:L-seryl-tRNA(Sec) selenium transferase [Clostridium formicaceticum]|uniref:L-seryl-tRNA(Sec) selenium transferase n=1 Tax=Clostridium formicaceticum TaxID=1497 RepID=A0AAC9RL77_9CLOT|nr:L-seryl-tRNA(Sec) selenium transferase [Clostridium formicaceticum]AOY76883.1 L-seryl-tRNA(Sec) selenium transferase [Clostridium formicaceticum]ARE87363.1 L-seryl-tRNA(Sec) selenium transferase [Clostridium formicaceticum]